MVLQWTYNTVAFLTNLLTLPSPILLTHFCCFHILFHASFKPPSVITGHVGSSSSISTLGFLSASSLSLIPIWHLTYLRVIALGPCTFLPSSIILVTFVNSAFHAFPVFPACFIAAIDSLEFLRTITFLLLFQAVSASATAIVSPSQTVASFFTSSFAWIFPPCNTPLLSTLPSWLLLHFE